jgi:hypothetical protein
MAFNALKDKLGRRPYYTVVKKFNRGRGVEYLCFVNDVPSRTASMVMLTEECLMQNIEVKNVTNASVVHREGKTFVRVTEGMKIPQKPLREGQTDNGAFILWGEIYDQTELNFWIGVRARFGECSFPFNALGKQGLDLIHRCIDQSLQSELYLLGLSYNQIPTDKMGEITAAVIKALFSNNVLCTNVIIDGVSHKGMRYVWLTFDYYDLPNVAGCLKLK